MAVVRLSDRSSQRRALLASFFGPVLESYDYFLYGTIAALVFPSLFFPNHNQAVSTASSLATLGGSYLARPIGAFIFGHLGDRVGRKWTLVMTMILIGIATALIGILPTYSAIGIAAPILLIILRLLQGIAIGGDFAGGVLLAVEHASTDRKALFGAVAQTSAAVGVLISNGIVVLVTVLSHGSDFLVWGWRIPFLLSLVLVVVGIIIRSRVEETPEFKALDRTQQPRVPAVEAIRRFPRNFFLIVFVKPGIDINFYVVTVFLLAYAKTTLHIASNIAVIGLVIAAGLTLITMPLSGRLADRFGPKQVLVAGLIWTAVAAPPIFVLINTKQPVLVWVAMILGYTGSQAFTYGPLASFVAGAFDSDVRYSGAGLSTQISGVIGGAFAPTVAALLVAASGTIFSVVWYVAGAAVIGVVCALFVRRVSDPKKVLDPLETVAVPREEALP